MSRLSRLSARDYRRLTPEQQGAVDLLRYGSPTDAERGKAKTILGWKRTTEETIAYANTLLGRGMARREIAPYLRVDVRYLDRLLNSNVEKASATETSHSDPAVSRDVSGLTGKARVIAHPDVSAGYSVYGSDPLRYDFEAELRRCTA